MQRHRRRLLRWLLGIPLAGCAAPLPAPRPTTVPIEAPTALPAPLPQPSPSPTARPAATVDPATLRARLEPIGRVTPLAPREVTVRVPGYSGPLELRIFDARGAAAGQFQLRIEDGVGITSVSPRGALGPQRAEALVQGRLIGAADPLLVLDAETEIKTGQARFDELYPRTRAFIEQCALQYTLGGTSVRGYRSPDNPLLWLRDHTYQARGFRYFERDMTSLIDAFRQAQRDDGSLPDWLPNPHYGVSTPGRKEVEADLEFLFVQAVYEAWQVTGDDAWLERNLSAMRRAVDYSMSDALRWDAERQLVKRPYTIDMWDFAYGPTTTDPSNGQPAPRHWIDGQTIWGIFHGDNTGLAHALDLLALAEERFGNGDEARRRRSQADELIDRLVDLSWNGHFFTHFVPLEPFEPPGVDASRQLSLSNTYALNREVLRARQGRAIVDEYFQRGLAKDAHVFAEWYSIDPPFPPGSYGLAGRPGERPGEYVNGGLMPLVGGELARGAFRYGAERYGFETLHRYYFLISSTGATYLWYYPEGNPGISGIYTLPSDGWGASAMLAAMIEGAAGVEDRGARFSATRLSPRWAATDDVPMAIVTVRYGASDGYAAYLWVREPQRQILSWTGSGERAELRMLLPEGVTAVREALLDGAAVPFELSSVFDSRYVIVTGAPPSGTLAVAW
jgi:hypothetical protein